MGKNDHVVAALKNLAAAKQPDAILVRGSWGSGKTHLVKEVLRPSQPLYVSLFGTSTSQEINLRILSAAYPLLQSKSAKAIGSLARSALGIFRFQSDLKAEDLFDLPTDQVIIFDDLERTSVDDKTLLGIINDFVEHDNCRVVAIINDQKRTSKEFDEAKEKVFSFTVSVDADFGKVFPIIRRAFTGKYGKFLDLIEEGAIKTFEQVNSDNLRTLSFAVKNFESWYKVLAQRLEDARIVDIFLIFATCSILVRDDLMSRDELSQRPTDKLLVAFKKQRREPLDKITELSEKLPFDLFNPVVGNELLISAIFDGFVDGGALDQLAKDLLPVKDRVENEPSWRVLWHHFNMDQVEFDDRKATFFADFKARRFLETGEILHAFGLLLDLSGHGLLLPSEEEAYSQCEAYLDDAGEAVPSQDERLVDRYGHGGAFGLGFQGDKTLLNELMRRLDAIVSENRVRSETGHLVKLLSANEIDIVALREALFGTSEDAGASNVPVLARLDDAELLERIMQLPIAQIRELGSIFSARLEEVHYRSSLRAEGRWFRNLKAGILKHTHRCQPLRKWQLSMLSGAFPSEKLAAYR